MSSDEDERPASNQGSLALRPDPSTRLPALPGSLLLGAVDAIHHKVQVNCKLPTQLSLPDASNCRCYFGDQVVQASQDTTGTLFCFAPPPKPCRGRYAQEKSCTLTVVAEDKTIASATFQYTALPFWRKPSLEGRFSGRLPTKEDEKKLAEECRLLAPLVGGTCEGRGERSMSSLAKLARAIASGRVRQHCEQREYRVQSLQQHVARLEAALQCGVQGLPGAPHASLGSAVALSAANATLQDEVRYLRSHLSARDKDVADLMQQLRLKEQLCTDLASGSCCTSALVPSGGNPPRHSSAPLSTPLPSAAALSIPAPSGAAEHPPNGCRGGACGAGACGREEGPTSGGVSGRPASPNSRTAKRQRQPLPLPQNIPGCSSSGAAQGCCGGAPGSAAEPTPTPRALGTSGGTLPHPSMGPLPVLSPCSEPITWPHQQQQLPQFAAPINMPLGAALLANLQPSSSSSAADGMQSLQQLLASFQAPQPSSASAPFPWCHASTGTPLTSAPATAGPAGLPAAFRTLEPSTAPAAAPAPPAPTTAAGPADCLVGSGAGVARSARMRSGEGSAAAHAGAAAATGVQAACDANPQNPGGCCTSQGMHAGCMQAGPGGKGCPPSALGISPLRPQKLQQEEDMLISSGGLGSPLVSLAAEGSLPDEDCQECCFGLIECPNMQLDVPQVDSSASSTQQHPPAGMVLDPAPVRQHTAVHMEQQQQQQQLQQQQRLQPQDPEVLRTLTASLSTAQHQLLLLQETQARQAHAYQEQQTQLCLLQRYLNGPPDQNPWQPLPNGAP